MRISRPNLEYAVVSAIAAVLWLAPTVTAHGRHDDDLTVREPSTIQKTFTLAAGANDAALEIDNIFGAIEVVGGSGNEIRLVANQEIRAETKEDLARAKQEVKLDISQQGNAVRLYVDGPFRCQQNCSDCMNWRERNYVVKVDFKLQVPSHMRLRLRTVNEGDIRVRDVVGDYDVRNVNGPIEMENAGGSGKVRTVNGRVRVTFRENPKENSEFTTINGNVELYFAPRLAADFHFKTMQGGVYSDYPLTDVPQAPTGTRERRGGRFVYHSNRFTVGRVGTGGPAIKLENLNGDLRVLERQAS